MIADLQSERMDEQRAQLPGLVTRGSRGPPPTSNAAATTSNVSQANASPRSARTFSRNNTAHDDAFLDMLMRLQVMHRTSSIIVCATIRRVLLLVR